MAIRGPIRYAEHLTRERYHPRSSKHGDFLSQALVLDLLDASPVLRSAAARGKLVFTANYGIEVADKSVADTLSEDARKDLAWNMDLVIGPPGDEPPPVLRRKSRRREEEAHLITPDIMKRGTPREVWLVVDAKGVMTEHGKARRNRQRDITALWTVMKTFMPNVIVGAVIPINVASKFKSPLRQEITDHGASIQRTVLNTLGIFRAVRKTSREGRGIDGLGCFVVDFDNMGGSQARYVEESPAPQPDDVIHYNAFVQDLIAALSSRFGSLL
jgi:hypothetical protein